jgi:hypothetical protein
MPSERTISLVNRVPNHPQAAAVKAAIAACLSLGEEFKGKRAELERDQRFTTMGRRDELKAALPGHARKLGAAASSIQKLRAEIKQRRAALQIPAPDRSDLAGAIERMEIRSWLRGLVAMARESVLRTTTDTRILHAAVSAPPELSGLNLNNSDIANAVERRALEMANAEEMQSIDDLEEVVAVGEAAVQIARGDLQSAAELDGREFEHIVGPAERGAGRPWLLKDGDRVQVCEVLPDKTARYRPATEYEKAEGRFYKNLAEYESVQAA